MTEKLLTFPSPTSPDPGDGVNRSKFNFFPEQHQRKPTKTFVPGQHARIQEIFCPGGGGGGCPGSSTTYFTVYRGVQWFYYTFSRGGPKANFYRNPYNINL